MKSLMFTDQISDAAGMMVAQLDEEIRKALDAHWPAGWTYDDVRRRCVLQRVAHDPVETFIADGIPLLHVWPVESETEQLADRYVLRYTRQIRRLYTGDTDA